MSTKNTADSIGGSFWLGPMATYAGIVNSLPFSASYEVVEVKNDEKMMRAERSAVGAIYRDVLGRERREVRIRHGEIEVGEIVLILNAAARTALALNPAEKTASRFSNLAGRLERGVLVSGWVFSGPWALQSEAREKMIEGIRCKRAMPFLPLEIPKGESDMKGEIWISEEIKYSILENTRSRTGEHHWRLFDVRRTEPPSSLFEIPLGYTEIPVPKLGNVRD